MARLNDLETYLDAVALRFGFSFALAEVWKTDARDDWRGCVMQISLMSKGKNRYRKISIFAPRKNGFTKKQILDAVRSQRDE